MDESVQPGSEETTIAAVQSRSSAHRRTADAAGESAARPADERAATSPQTSPPNEAKPDDGATGEQSAATAWQAGFHLSRWLQQFSAMIVSGAVHMAALIVLSVFVVEPPPVGFVQEVVAEVLDPVEVREELKIELENQLAEVTERTELFSASMAVGDVGASGPQALVSAPTVDKSLLEQAVNSHLNVEGIFIDVPSTRRLIVEAPDGQVGDARAIVDSYQEALDRITQEILWMLDKGPVLVVWLFDQSRSMLDDQKEIRSRIEHVYIELGLLSKANEGALQTAICSYGDKNNFRVHSRQPTSVRSEILAAIDEIPVDESGQEFMCSAVLQALALHRPYAQRTRRQLAFIVVTDESGNESDNDMFLERALTEAKAARCRVYTLGREAMFGYPYVWTRWDHPESQRRYWLRMDRGPETAFVEQLQINGYRRRDVFLGSGFGPYVSTRLARETGGIFFLLPTIETSLVRAEQRRRMFDMQAAYYPDLRSRPEVKADIEKSPLRATLEKVIYDLNPYKEKMVELRYHDFAVEYDRLAQQIRQDLAKVPALLQYLAKAEETVAKLADARKQEASPRWQANYDLLHAQTIAYQARVYEYAAYMEQFLKDLEAFVRNPADPKNKFRPPPKTKAPNLVHENWDCQLQQQTLNPDKIKPYVERSTAMFKAIIANHPGTPWAAAAEWELRRGFGVRLVPDYEPPMPKVPDVVPKF